VVNEEKWGNSKEGNLTDVEAHRVTSYQNQLLAAELDRNQKGANARGKKRSRAKKSVFGNQK